MTKVPPYPKIYLAGAMESAPTKDLNFPLFDLVAEKLRALGCEVFSPVDFTRELIGSAEDVYKMSEQERKDLRGRLLARELSWICLQADAVFMLPGWELSPGAKAEHATALAMRKPVHEVSEYMSLDKEGE